jgi:endonuclease-3 related protein
MEPPALYKKLSSCFGPQLWWPVTDEGGTEPVCRKRGRLDERQMLEVCVGAILTQNTSWKNAEKALINLNRAGMVSVERMAACRQQRLASLIRPSGYYNQKAERLRLFCLHLKKNYSCSLIRMFAKPVKELRGELLSLKGIGPETADSIILYSARKPAFVVDAYTKRLAERLYGITFSSYDGLQSFFEASLSPPDSTLFAEYHALIVEFCKRICRKKPLCKGCFLRTCCRNAAFCAGSY